MYVTAEYVFVGIIVTECFYGLGLLSATSAAGVGLCAVSLAGRSHGEFALLPVVRLILNVGATCASTGVRVSILLITLGNIVSKSRNGLKGSVFLALGAGVIHQPALLGASGLLCLVLHEIVLMLTAAEQGVASDEGKHHKTRQSEHQTKQQKFGVFHEFLLSQYSTAKAISQAFFGNAC